MSKGQILVDLQSHEARSSKIDFLADLSQKYASQVIMLPIADLAIGESPRLHGTNDEHVKVLAESSSEMPPILVQLSSLRIIDGAHRLKAALSRGQHEVSVRMLDCDDFEAFMIAVASNVRHGMPLTLAERRAAARRILEEDPDVSDRWIAAISGLSDKTIAAVRKTEGRSLSGGQRIGRDGRIRPLHHEEGRARAEKYLEHNPHASLRQISEYAGISVGTARRIRSKIKERPDGVPPPSSKGSQLDVASDRTARETSADIDCQIIVRQLISDPSLRYSSSGRILLRWLSRSRLVEPSDWQEILGHIPARWTTQVARIAYICAASWWSFAQELEQRQMCDLVTAAQGSPDVVTGRV